MLATKNQKKKILQIQRKLEATSLDVNIKKGHKIALPHTDRAHGHSQHMHAL